jgi:hypothetical protein
MFCGSGKLRLFAKLNLQRPVDSPKGEFMKNGVTTLERAFQLANSGQVTRLVELRVALAAEGHDPKQLEGPLLRKQLLAAFRKAKQASPPKR